MLLWAEGGPDLSPWWIAGAIPIATAIGLVGRELWTLISARRDQKKQDRIDALEEWKEIAEKAQERIDVQITEARAAHERHEKDIAKLQERAEAAYDREHKCQLVVARMEGELKLQESMIRRLQHKTGDAPPAVVSSGIMVTDQRGIIKTASPALTPIFRYLPNELVGKSVEILIPVRHLEKHRLGMSRMIATSNPPWPDKPIITEGVTKEGAEVPIAITLFGWQTEKGDWLVTAEIRLRQPAGTIVHDNTPTPPVP